jgi:K+-transporting ATPase A subunit
MQSAHITSDMFRIFSVEIVLTLPVRPFGGYMEKVYQGERSLLSPIIGQLEKGLYRITGIDRDSEMDWKLKWTRILRQVYIPS